jgi:predicted permease
MRRFSLGADLRFGFRMLRRNPVFTVAAMLTLALGIGVATAIFNVADETLLSPLPLPEPQQLVAVYSFDKKSSDYLSTSYPDFEDFNRRNHSFQHLSAYVRLSLKLQVRETAERIWLEAVSGDYFSMLDLPPLVGRAFGAEDSQTPVIMLGEELWRQRFGSDTNLIGKTVALEGVPLTVIGIVPGRYRGANLNWGDPPQAWIPFSAVPLVLPRFKKTDIFHRRSARWVVMLGRLKQGLTVSQAQSELRLIAANLAQAEPVSNRDITVAAFPAARSKFWPAYRASTAQILMAFSAGAGLLLLLARANVANLLLERAFARRREMAIRTALGAGPGWLVRQLMAENFLLVIFSFFAALLISVALDGVLARFPAFEVSLALNLGIGARVLVFGCLLSLATAFLFGLLPSLHASRADVVPALKETGNTPLRGERGNWLRHFLVVVQVGFSMALLVAGGIFARSVMKAYSVDLGFSPAHLLLMSFEPPGEQNESGVGEAFTRAALRRTLTLPGVETATVAWDVPLTMMQSTTQLRGAEGQTPEALRATFNMVGPDYFHAFGIAILAGRDFTWADKEDSPKVAIVNQALAGRLWPGSNALGRAVMVEDQPGRNTLVQVVGLARDSKYNSVWESPQPYIYFVAWQWHYPATNLILRARGEPQSLVREVQRSWQEACPNVPLEGLHTGTEHVKMSLAPQRFAAGLLASFAIIAAIVASIGLYGVIAYGVARRRRDIGIRMALGAEPVMVVRGILRQALSLTAAGLVLGAGATFALMRLIASQVKGVSPYDWVTFAAVSVLLCGVAAGAALIPAFRAARADPLAALRSE